MAIKYVRTNGADGTGGHDGSSAALAWLTLGYAMTNVSAGDSIYVGAGTYRVTSAIAPSSMASETFLIGDVDGAKTGDSGEVVITNYGTNDTTAPSSTDVFAFASKNYWTLRYLTIQAAEIGAYYPVNISGTSHDLKFQDCTIYAPFLASGFTFGTVLNLTIERCRVKGQYGGIYINLPSSATGSDVNANVLIRNCFAWGSGYSIFINEALNTYKTGGVTVANCLFTGGTDATFKTGETSTTYPVYCYNNFIIGDTCLKSTVTGQIVEDYNVLIAGTTPRTNVSAGANSLHDGSRNWRFSLGHERSFGGVIRAFGEWSPGIPLNAWGGSTATGVPTDDITGVTRPASGVGSTSKALGPFERANSGTRETSTVRTGSNAMRLSGPGYHDFALPVAAISTTVTVYGRFDSNYGAGTKPTMSVRNGGECGVADATATMTVAAGNWEQLSLNFTPTSAGIVTIRLASLGSAATGYTFFDDFAVA